MNRKQAHQRKYLKLSYYRRNREIEWQRDYTSEQLAWLWKHKHIEYCEPFYELGERDDTKYIRFTSKGSRWHAWYSMSFTEYLKYYIFRFVDIKIAWQRIRIACGHRYDWMDYEEIN